jgi:hypothetical protein
MRGGSESLPAAPQLRIMPIDTAQLICPLSAKIRERSPRLKELLAVVDQLLSLQQPPGNCDVPRT